MAKKAFSLDIDFKAFTELTKRVANLNEIVADKVTASRIGKIAVAGIRSFTSVGQTPIRSTIKRYPAYKNPKRYPGKRKAKRPVNLRLSGDFMEALDFKLIKGSSGYNINLGYFDNKNSLKEQGHREGANGQPIRPTIPIQGEDFNVTIQNDMETALGLKLKSLLKKL